jgi:lipid-binding SYLF domain-containing protein
MTINRRSLLLGAPAALTLAACASTPAEKANRAQDLVDAATITVDRMRRDPDRQAMNALIARSHGVMVFPSLIKGGLIWGGQGGSGVLLARNESGWSAPAFYSMGGISWGLQIGVQDSEVIMVVMSEKGMEAVTRRGVKLGADASVAAGPEGASAQGAASNLTFDIYVFANTAGAFAGLSVEGAWVESRDDFNHAYYGRAELEPTDIVRRRLANNPGADRLRAALAR